MGFKNLRRDCAAKYPWKRLISKNHTNGGFYMELFAENSEVIVIVTFKISTVRETTTTTTAAPTTLSTTTPETTTANDEATTAKDDDDEDISKINIVMVKGIGAAGALVTLLAIVCICWRVKKRYYGSKKTKGDHVEAEPMKGGEETGEGEGQE